MEARFSGPVLCEGVTRQPKGPLLRAGRRRRRNAQAKSRFSGPGVAEGVTRQAKSRFSGPGVAEGVTRQAKSRFSGPGVAEGVTRQAKSRFSVSLSYPVAIALRLMLRIATSTFQRNEKGHLRPATAVSAWYA